MRTALSMLLGVAIVFALTLNVKSEEKADKEVKLTGKLVCGKCALKETDDCSNVVQVKEGDKTVNYYIKDEGKKETYHKNICTAGKDGKAVTVTGKVSEKDGKKWITGAKVEFDK
jgi:hypothetical protein